MGFRINTNIAAMDAHQKSTLTNRGLDKSLGSLASGLRINSAADDASGLVIADSLRSQANSLGQAVRNANDAIGIIQTADKAMDEQIKILDTIKTKAIQSASDGQSASSREAIQKDVDRLISSLNNIAQTTSFNGQSLLAGKYTDKEFQVGAYSNQSVSASIGNTESVAIGNIQQTTDSTQLGNVVSTTAASGAGTVTISVAAADLNGLGRGDIISFEGSASTYSVQEVISSSGTIELAVPLNEDIASGAKISVDTYANNPAGYLEASADVADAATTISMAVSQLQGLAVGDSVTFVNSAGTSQTQTVEEIAFSTATVTLDAAITSGGAVANGARVFIDSSAVAADVTLTTGGSGLGATVLNIDPASVDGYAIGDVIQITNGTSTEQFVIDEINTTAGNITLNNAMATAFSAGSTMSVLTAADNLLHLEVTANISTGATSTTLDDTVLDIRGLAAGDVLSVVMNDGTTEDVTISNIVTSTGVISFASAIVSTVGATAAQGGILVKTADVLGNSLTSSDYVQYTIEGQKIDGVQLTDDNGYGTAGSGLGRVAEQINILSDVTGVRAVADVSATGTAQITATTTTADMTINGVTVASSGTTVLAGDSDNKLIDAINAKTSETGVSATLVDGALKLESDGRAMALSGFTSVTNISDGVTTGELVFTKSGSDPMDITSAHYADANLATSNSNATTTLDVNATAFNLSDLVNGRIDDNGDGTVDSNDTIGLLRTREGANVAIDIVGKAIEELDTTRSGLGSAQNELIVTVNNISVTQVNVKAAESQIRDVDFAAESANFSRLNILAQSGSYAMSQANAVQQNVLRLLQ